MKADVAYIHVRRSENDGTNAILGAPVLKGITNQEAIENKDILVVDDMLDEGVTMHFVLDTLSQMNPKSIHVAVLYSFVKEDSEKYIAGLHMDEKKWIVYPWETKLS